MSIQAAELRADVIVNHAQAVQQLNAVWDVIQRMEQAAGNGLTYTVTANTQQAQQQIAQLTQTISQSATPPTITPLVDSEPATKEVVDLLTQIRDLTAANQPTVEPKVDPVPAKTGLAAFLASVQATATGAVFAFNQVTQAAQTVLGPLESLVGEAVSAYESHERLSNSLEQLTAKELLHAGAATTMTEALAKAGPKAEELLQWNQQLAIHSPFTQEGVAQAFKMAQAYGFVSESADANVISAKRLTEAEINYASATGANEETMRRLALALGQVQAKGKLAGDEVLQLVEAGVNVDQILADAFGKSKAEIAGLREKGLIPADQAIKAIVQSMEHDYAGAAERMNGSLEGLGSSLSDLKTVGLDTFFDATFKAIQPVLQQFVDTLSDPAVKEQIKGWGDALGHGVAEALPVLVEGVKETTQFLGEMVTAGQAVASFFGDTGVPILEGAAGAFVAYRLTVEAANVQTALFAATQTTELIPALIALTTETGAAAAATALAAAPFVAIAAVIATATYAVSEYNREMAETIKQQTDSQGWKTGTDAIDAYNKASKDTQATMADNIVAFEHNREQLTEESKSLASVKFWWGETSQAYQEQKGLVATHTQALAEQSTVIQQQVTDLEAHKTKTDDATKATGDHADAQKKLAVSLELSGEALKKYNAQMAEMAEKGSAAFGKLDSIQDERQEKLESLQTEHGEKLKSIQDGIDRQAEDADDTHQQKLLAIQAKGADDQQKAYDDLGKKLKDAQGKEQRDEESALADHQQKLVDIDAKAVDDRGSAAESLNKKQRDLQDKLSQDLTDGDQDLQDSLVEIDAKGVQQRSDLAESHAEKLASIQQKMDSLSDADAQAAIQKKIDDEQFGYDQRLGDMENAAEKSRQAEDANYVERLGALEANLNDQMDAENTSYDERLQTQQDKVAESLANLEAVYKANNDRLADLAREGQEKLTDSQTDHDDKLVDLHDRATEKQASLEESHADKIAQINRDKARVTSVLQLQQLQEREALENEAYRRQSEANAVAAKKAEDAENAAYEKKKARMVRDLNEQIEAEKEAAAKRAQAAQDSLTQQQQAVTTLTTAHNQKLVDLDTNYDTARANANKDHADKLLSIDQKLSDDAFFLTRSHNEKLTALDGEMHEDRLSKKRQALQDDLDAEDVAYGKSLTRLDRSITEQVAHANQEHDKKAADLAVALDRDTATAAAAYDERLSDIDVALGKAKDKEGQSYDERLTKLKTNLDLASQTAVETYTDRLTDLDKALADQTAKENTAYADRLAKLSVSLDDKEKAENDAYAKAEKAANTSYDKQEAAQRKHLGQMLDDYLKAEEQRYPQMAAKIEAERKKVQDEYGLVDKAANDAWKSAADAVNQAIGISINPQLDANVTKMDAVHQKLQDEKDVRDNASRAARDYNALLLDSNRQMQDGTNALRPYNENLNTTAENLEKCKTKLADVNVGTQSWFHSITDLGSWLFSGTPSGGGATPPGRASGGPTEPHAAYTIGENGPETLVMGDDPGFVVPTGGMLPRSGGGTTIVNHIQISIDAGTLVHQNQLGDYLRQATNEYFRNNPTATGSPFN